MIRLLKTFSSLSLLFSIALLTTLAGCAGTLMTEVKSPEILPPAPDKVKIVFMRNTAGFREGGYAANLFEVIDGDLRFIGELLPGTKIVHETTPGSEKVFMSVHSAGSTEFLLGKLTGGKIYYSNVILTFMNFMPLPVRAKTKSSTAGAASPDLPSWYKDAKLIAPNAEASDWFNVKREHYQTIYKDNWAKFQRETPEEKAERTLNPQDGFSE